MITYIASFLFFWVIFQGLLSPLVPGSLQHLNRLLTDVGWVTDYNTQDILLFVQPILSTPCDNSHREAAVVPNVSAVVFKRLLTVFFVLLKFCPETSILGTKSFVPCTVRGQMGKKN